MKSHNPFQINYQLICKVFLGLLLLSPKLSLAGDDEKKPLSFTPNLGQWEGDFEYRCDTYNSAYFLEKNGFSVGLMNSFDIQKVSNPDTMKKGYESEPIRCHSYQVRFKNANDSPTITGGTKESEYSNYYTHKDADRWRSNVPSHNEVKYNQIYDGIDALFYSSDSHFKYDFLVHSNGNPNSISLVYDGVDSMYIESGNLILLTTVGTVKELKPFAFQLKGQDTLFVPCEYVLNENEISFNLPNGYQTDLQLIIDPVVIASTFCGSTAESYTHATTYSLAGEMYHSVGNMSFPGYPITPGAFITTYSSMNRMAISKWTQDCSTLLFSTYFSGDNCLSMHVNANDDLYVLSCFWGDFQTTPAAYDTSFAGNGAYDYGVSVFNSTGTNLMYSTCVGGSEYEQDVGELVIDDQGYVYVCGGTKSADFPTTSGAYDTSLSGSNFDAVVFKLSPNLDTLVWSTFLGGTQDDWALGLHLNDNNEVYIGGVMRSGGQMLGTGYQPAKSGATDAFIAHFSNDGAQLLHSTYLGAGGKDEISRIEIDVNGDIVVAGISSNLTSTPGSLSLNPTNDNFLIAKFDPLLNSAYFIQRAGFMQHHTSQVKMPIQALKTDDCGQIYVAAAQQNPLWNPATMPISPNAVQSAPTGMYIGVFSSDGLNSVYGTYWGNVNGSRVLRGHSRFNEDMILYQGVSVTISSQISWPFPTLPNSYEELCPHPDSIIGGTQHTDAIYVFDPEQIEIAPVNMANIPMLDTTVCVGDPVSFSFIGDNTNPYEHYWDFGDGSNDNSQSPSHVYLDSGVYDVYYVIVDTSLNCIAETSDTIFGQVTVNWAPTPDVDLGEDIVSCESVTLDASQNSVTYLWQDNTTSSTLEVNQTGTYWVEVSNGTCSSFDTIDVVITDIPVVNTIVDQTIALGNSVQLTTTSTGTVYEWTPPTGLSCTDCQNPIASPTNTTTYTVTVYNGDCWSTDQVTIYVSGDLFIPNIFSPNADGFNDILYVRGNQIAQMEFYIYDRWGERVFQSNDATYGWDGSFRGKNMNPAVFYYSLEVTFNNGEKKDLKGDITLTR